MASKSVQITPEMKAAHQAGDHQYLPVASIYPYPSLFPNPNPVAVGHIPPYFPYNHVFDNYTVIPDPETGEPRLYNNGMLVHNAVVDGISNNDEGSFAHVRVKLLFPVTTEGKPSEVRHTMMAPESGTHDHLKEYASPEAIQDIMNWLPSEEQAKEVLKSDTNAEKEADDYFKKAQASTEYINTVGGSG